MEGDSDSSGLWHRLSRLFNNKDTDPVEQAIKEAGEEGDIQAEEESMLLRVLALDDLQVEDIMTPRTDICGVEVSATIAEAIDVIIETGHSRIPVYEGDSDNIVGLIYGKDLLRETRDAGKLSAPVGSVMRQPFFVPETKNVLEVLQEFRARKTHLAVILDEFGGTTGLVTIEDVLEQIVGDIEDEHDAPKEEDIRILDDGGALLSGRAYLDDINEKLGLKIESDEVDTIGGHISHLLGRVPEPGEELEIGGLQFRIMEADARQIHSVRLERNTAQASGK